LLNLKDSRPHACKGSDARQHRIADTLSKLTRDELRRAGQRSAT